MPHRSFMALVLVLVSCARAVPEASRPPGPQSASTDSGAADPSDSPLKVAVLPIEAGGLFRKERSALRTELLFALKEKLPTRTFAPLDEVDGVLRRASKKGEACAFQETKDADRAEKGGFMRSEVIPISGKEEELWIRLHGVEEGIGFRAKWDASRSVLERYRIAFANLIPMKPGEGLLLGGLGMRGRPRGLVGEKGFSLCAHPANRKGEIASWGACSPLTESYRSLADPLRSCFSDEDDTEFSLLVDGRACEAEGVDVPMGNVGRLETCTCAAIAIRPPGRHRLWMHFEAQDLVGRARPEMRIVEAATSLRARSGWHYAAAQKKSVYRLEFEGLDELAAPLARCSPPPGALVTMDLELTPTGHVGGARVLSGAADQARCIEKMAARGRFDCPSGEASGHVRVVAEWP